MGRRFAKRYKQKQKKTLHSDENWTNTFPKLQKTLFSNLDKNKKKLKSVYTESSDVVFRSFPIGDEQHALFIYIDGLSDTSALEDNVLSELMDNHETEDDLDADWVKDNIPVSSIKEVHTFSDCISEVSAGNPVMLLKDSNIGLSFGLSDWEQRDIEPPDAEKIVRGPREAFIETLSVNTAMIRRKIRDPALKMHSMQVGNYTETEVIITYVEGIADDTLIKEIKNRIDRIDIDGILETGMIEDLIEDTPSSPFPQVLATERPDVVTSSLLEGRAAILLAGTPFAIIVPTSLVLLLQTHGDNYGDFISGTMIRILRLMLIFITLHLPSLYVAIITFHQEMIPTSLLISFAAAHEQIPFPILIEALIMEITFEALREAGTRMPLQVGSAVSIVGALVIGEAAVQAGIVSAPMVIVVAITGLASFSITRYSLANTIRMLRFPLIFLAGTLGLIGMMMGVIALVIHLSTLRSFGYPYLSPLAPMSSGMKDALIRTPLWNMNKRPHFTGKYNKYRQSSGQKPGPNRGGD